jgi:hypothetical protein
MVSVPLRASALLAATVKATVPLPLPDPPLVIEIHGAFADAVHEQPAPAVTATEPPPPLASTDWLLGEIANVHGGGAAACVTVSVWPAMVSVPLRAAPGFAVAVYVTEPLPDPVAPREIVIHGAFDEAVHAQLASAITSTALLPPTGGTD